MRSWKLVLCVLCFVGLCALTQQATVTSSSHAWQTLSRTFVQSNPVLPAQKRIVIGVSTLLDGKGGRLRDTRIVIDGSRIVAIDSKVGPIDYDLRGLTVLPGWIDAHVHITWSFGKDGKSNLY